MNEDPESPAALREAVRLFARDRDYLERALKQLRRDMVRCADETVVLAVTRSDEGWQEGVDDARQQIVARLRNLAEYFISDERLKELHTQAVAEDARRTKRFAQIAAYQSSSLATRKRIQWDKGNSTDPGRVP